MFQKLGLKSAILVGAFSAVACGGVCGDGAIDELNDFDLAEACDDGNAVAGDGCNATCGAIEDGFDCPTAGAACVPTCGNGQLDAGEECDGAVFDPAISCEAFLATGTPNCNADCSASGDTCVAVAGDGVRSSDLLVPGQGEQCDDGNLTNGDGCSANMELEALTSIVLVDAAGDAAELNNTTPDGSSFAVWGAVGGVDLDGDGVLDGGFDFDGDGVAGASYLFLIATDQTDICDTILANGLNVLNEVFGGNIAGSTGLLFIEFPGDQALANNTTFTGEGPLNLFLDPGVDNATGLDLGYIEADGAGGVTSDTTAGGDGLGTLTLESFTFNSANLSGNLTLNAVGLRQTTQFAGGAAGAIDSLISIDVNGAPSCTLEFLQ
jgi:cysteine-rich repeat protein